MGFHEFCGGDERKEEGHGGKFVYALDAGRDAGDVVRERKGDYGGGCVGEGGGDVWVVGGGGEEGDGGVSTEEEAN